MLLTLFFFIFLGILWMFCGCPISIIIMMTLCYIFRRPIGIFLYNISVPSWDFIAFSQ